MWQWESDQIKLGNSCHRVCVDGMQFGLVIGEEDVTSHQR